TSIGGASSQSFYDDGTHGDSVSGDNVFSFQATAGALISPGVKYIVSTITDAQSRAATAPITLTVLNPTCGEERWPVKTGTDADAGLVDLAHPVRGTISDLISIPAPAVLSDNNRIVPTETTVFVLNALLTKYKEEDDFDYHLILQDEAGNTMITEIPSPACVGASSPFRSAIASSRTEFDAHLTATTSFQTANLPVYMTGVGFFDFIHGQTGVAPNGIELHPVLSISFTSATTTTLVATPNPSSYGQPVTITATVDTGGVVGTPSGNVAF